MTPVPTPKLRTPARRTVKRWVPYDYGAERKRTPNPDPVELNGKSDGDETGPEADSDVRGSSAGEFCDVFEVCSHFFLASHFFCTSLFPRVWFIVHTA